MEIQIDQSTVDYLERLAYEEMGKMNLIDHILTSHAKDPDDSVVDGAPFQRLLSDYEKASAEYSVAKNKLEKDYELNGKTWNLDFETGICTVE